MRLKAERRIRRLLYEDRKAQPDIVQYGNTCIYLYWHGAEHSIVVEISDEGEIGESRLGDPPPGEERCARARFN
jgi:hypothetical protein